MEKAVAAVLTLFVVLMVPVLDAAPMIKAVGPIRVPKTRLVLTNATIGDVKSLYSCPGGQSGCLQGYQTCCLHTSGNYACCEHDGANCCHDYVSCCQSGFVCDDASGGCLKAGIRPGEDVFEKSPLSFLKK